ncbi:hypothetical protein MJO29_001524 [Puccinia striiformis f. sp. tritici]|nr:hypothetical protein MJO29_001524 [Puccinia striiformis f. sp. tritici]
MDDGIEQAILTNEELLRATATILNEQLASHKNDIHSFRFCPDFHNPNHQVHHFSNDPLQLGLNSLTYAPTDQDEPIDPRLIGENVTINQSIFNHTLLGSTPSDPRSNPASQKLPHPSRSAKRRKTNLKKPQSVCLHALDIPTCATEQVEIGTQQEISVNEIHVPTGDSQQSHSRIDESLDTVLTSIFKDSRKDSSTYENLGQESSQQIPNASIPIMLDSTNQTSVASRAELSLQYGDTSSSSFAAPNIHPFLQTIDPSLTTSIQSLGQIDTGCAQTAPKTVGTVRQVSRSPKQPQHTTLYPGNSQVDVHGVGAGGGAASVLAAAAAHQASRTKVSITQEGTMSTSQQNEEVRQGRFGEDGFEAGVEPLPTSYNSDQFRSCNRIHWTKDEEELLLAEVELHWEQHDCMAQIMKRHGPRGSISKTFAARTGVSLKDKAVNISSKWYRDGTEVSATRRRAFARFRPKQLRGKPRNELPGMTPLTDSFTTCEPDGPNPQDSSPSTSSQ